MTDIDKSDTAAPAGLARRPNPLLEAIRSELSLLLAAEDLGPNLYGIAVLATKARELWMAIHTPEVAIKNSNYSTNYFGTIPVLSPTQSGPIGPAQGPAEQFGSTAVRELVSSIPELLTMLRPPPSLESLVRSIDSARELGLNEVADKLQEKLFARLETTVAESPKGNAIEEIQ